MYQQTYFTTCTALLLSPQVSMNYDIMFCAKRGEGRLASFHHVNTAFLCMSFMSTTRLPFGDAAGKVNPLYKVPSYMDR